MAKHIKYLLELATLLMIIAGVIGLCWEFLEGISF